MTVVSSSNNITFAGDGVQIQFDFNFKIFREEDLAAVVRDSLGVEKQLVAGTDFKLISGPEIESGGRVSYPLSGPPLQVGESITFYRDIAYSQELELVDNDPFSAGLLNEAFDRGVMRDQQLQEQVARSLKYDISTPVEEQLMPQEFMNTVISSRDAANMAQSGAETAKAEAQVAQSAAEIARSGAETAQVAAEYAKDQAEELAWGELTSLRSDMPILAGPETATEGETVAISITDYVEDSVINYEIDVAGFGSAQLVGSVISWTLGSVDIDTPHFINVIRRKRGEIYSETAVHQILVKDVQVNDGPTVVFSNDTSGWPDAIIDGDGIHSPANSVGAINTKQIVSGEMEIEVASGGLTILAGTTDKLFKSSDELTEGGMFVADVGKGRFGAVTENSVIVPDVESAPNEWRGTGDVVGSGITVVDGLTSATPTVVWDHDLTGEFDFEWLAKSQATSTYLGLIPSSVAHTGAENYMFNYTNEMIKDVFVIFCSSASWQYPTQSLATYSGTVVDGATKMRMTRDADNLCSFYVDDVLIATRVQTGILRFWAGTHSANVKFQDFAQKGENSPNFEAVIDLSSAPTKMFKNPLQGESVNVNVGVGTTNISFESSDELIEGQKFDSDKGDFDAGVVVESGADSVIDYWGAGGGISYATHIDLANKIPNGATLTQAKGNFNTAATVGPHYGVFRDNGDGTYTCVYIKAVGLSIGYQVLNYVIPDTGDHYFGISCTTMSMYAGSEARTGAMSDTRITTAGEVLTVGVSTTPMSVVFDFSNLNYTADITAAGLAEAPN